MIHKAHHEKTCLLGFLSGKTKLACLFTDTSYRLAVSDIETRGIVLSSNQQRHLSTPFVIRIGLIYAGFLLMLQLK